ncbi:hypothetical protein [Aquisalimonas asiatica]|uniref:Uncharacterized protein n=1 Tax=Aquisalimonas asiatica TaxID=406100 RepID=A0A1H8VHV6_9GAMM|nr:hypothetical protein [Aquisalimonas asiatica]SEP14961.1 hypothetical protein SAMN04488052_11291 [Aquisalimonas asiatica]
MGWKATLFGIGGVVLVGSAAGLLYQHGGADDAVVEGKPQVAAEPALPFPGVGDRQRYHMEVVTHVDARGRSLDSAMNSVAAVEMVDADDGYAMDVRIPEMRLEEDGAVVLDTTESPSNDRETLLHDLMQSGVRLYMDADYTAERVEFPDSDVEDALRDELGSRWSEVSSGLLRVEGMQPLSLPADGLQTGAQWAERFGSDDQLAQFEVVNVKDDTVDVRVRSVADFSAPEPFAAFVGTMTLDRDTGWPLLTRLFYHGVHSERGQSAVLSTLLVARQEDYRPDTFMTNPSLFAAVSDYVGGRFSPSADHIEEWVEEVTDRGKFEEVQNGIRDLAEALRWSPSEGDAESWRVEGSASAMGDASRTATMLFWLVEVTGARALSDDGSVIAELDVSGQPLWPLFEGDAIAYFLDDGRVPEEEWTLVSGDPQWHEAAASVELDLLVPASAAGVERVEQSEPGTLEIQGTSVAVKELDNAFARVHIDDTTSGVTASGWDLIPLDDEGEPLRYWDVRRGPADMLQDVRMRDSDTYAVDWTDDGALSQGFVTAEDMERGVKGLHVFDPDGRIDSVRILSFVFPRETVTVTATRQ